MKDRFGKERERDAARRQALEREAAEEVERLTRQSGRSGMGGPGGMGPGMGADRSMGPPSPLEMMAQQMMQRRGARKAPERRSPSPPPAGRVTAAGLISGSVGSGLGPAGLSPGPGMGQRPKPFVPEPDLGPGMGSNQFDLGPMDMDETQPPAYSAPDDGEDEEMTITEMALMDHAARSGSNPEDLVIQVDAQSAEEARDHAMREFMERQRRGTSPAASARIANDPFAPAGMRHKAVLSMAAVEKERRQANPTQLGGALGRLTAQRRQRAAQEQPRPATPTGRRAPAAPTGRRAPAGPAEPSPEPSQLPIAPQAPSGLQAEPPGAGGALGRLLAKRRQGSTGTATEMSPAPVAEPAAAIPLAPVERSAPLGRRHTGERAAARATASTAAAGRPARKTPVTGAGPKKAPARKAPARKAPSRKAPAQKAAPRTAPAKPARKAAATAKAPATKATTAKSPLKKTAPSKKKAVAKKAPAKKAGGRRPAGG